MGASGGDSGRTPRIRPRTTAAKAFLASPSRAPALTKDCLQPEAAILPLTALVACPGKPYDVTILPLVTIRIVAAAYSAPNVRAGHWGSGPDRSVSQFGAPGPILTELGQGSGDFESKGRH